MLLSALWRGEASLALPALGGLFASSATRELQDCALANARLYEAIFRLAWLRGPAGLVRVNWRDMETEELGSVYESLLELSPRVDGAAGFAFVAVRGHERKTTASYYTPDSLVQALLDETLDPLLDATVAGKEGPAAIQALLALRIIDPACGSGHFLLAAARRLATRLAQLASPGAPSPADFRHWLREAARRCLFGVDRNPMAVELAKVALWIETVEPGKPLSFLDAHLRCGDSLLGIYDLTALQAGIPDEAYKPLTGDDKVAASAWRKRNQAEREARMQGELALFEPPRALLEAARALEAASEDDLAAVEAKAAAFKRFLAGPDRYRLECAADLYLAAFLLPKTTAPARHVGERGTFVPTSRDLWDLLAGHQPHGLLIGQAIEAARAAHAFHWPLEFPQVMAAGGFDLALGNPPWERIKLQEQEFFAARDPAIATAANKAARQKLIDALADAPAGSAARALHEDFVRAKREAEAASLFARVPEPVGGRYPLTGVGDVNTYALFAELFAVLGQRAGVIVPTGIATADQTKQFFDALVSKRRLISLYSFFEIRKIFPATDDRNPFCLLAVGKNNGAMQFAFSLESTDQIADRRRRFTLTPADIARINPNTRTCPIFRTGYDAELTRKLYGRAPILIDEAKGAAGNPWGITFATMFHMSNDSELFRTADQLKSAGYLPSGRGWVSSDGDTRWVPMNEGEYGHQFNHRFATCDGTDSRPLTASEKADPSFEVQHRYWVQEADFEARLARRSHVCRTHLLGFRRIARNTDERTVVASLLPFTAASYGWILTFARNAMDASLLVACYNSLVFDYCLRIKLSQASIPQGTFYQTACLPPAAFTPADLAFIVPRVLELTYTSHAIRPFALDLGCDGPPFAWDPERRAMLRAELDACYARLYGLTRAELCYILDPKAVRGPDWPSETFRVLQQRELRELGEYRTARLVLAAWDRLASGELAA